MTQQHLIFLSHAQVDAGPAGALKQWLRDRFPGFLDVFASSDWESIEQGREWYDKIRDALSTCDLGLVLVTPNSIRRPWVSFEIGGLKLINKDVIPVCIGVDFAELPVYISRNQACKYESPSDRLSLLKSIALHLGLPKEFINNTITLRAAQKAPKLIVAQALGSVDPHPSHELPIERAFRPEDRWTTVIYTCRATFTSEVCPNTLEGSRIGKCTCLHVPVDELQTVCLAVNHLLPVTSRHEDDAVSTVMCSMEAERALSYATTLRPNVPELLDRDLIIIGENNFSNLLMHRMKPYLPWERHLYWEQEQPDKPGRPMVYIRLTNHARRSTMTPAQIDRIGKGGALISVFPNPFNVSKSVIVLMGCHREGQFTLEEWLRRPESGVAFDLLRSAVPYSERRNTAVQLVINRAGPTPYGGIVEFDAGIDAIPYIEDGGRPFWLYKLQSLPKDFDIATDAATLVDEEVYDVSVIARLSDDAHRNLKQDIFAEVQEPDLYWEDEASIVGFHITVYEFLPHIKPDQRLVTTLNDFLREINESMEQTSVNERPSLTTAVIRGIETMQHALICYVDFPVADVSAPHWIEGVRLWCEAALHRTSFRSGPMSAVLNRRRVPFPTHITLCRFNKPITGELEGRLRALPCGRRYRQRAVVQVDSLYLTVAKRRPFKDVSVVGSFSLRT